RILAATLSADWVFAQNPRSVQQVVDLIMDPMGLRGLLATFTQRPRWEGSPFPLALPSGCGREEILKRGFALLDNDLALDFASDICTLMCANGTNEELAARWQEYYESTTNKLRWLNNGLDLEVFSSMPTETLRLVLYEGGWTQTTLAYLFKANRPDVFEDDEKAVDSVVDAILQHRLFCKTTAKIESPISAFFHSLSAHRYARAFHERDPRPLSESWRRSHYPVMSSFPNEDARGSETVSKCLHVIRIAEVQSQRSTLEWATEIGPWELLVEAARDSWGDAPLLLSLAVVAAGIRSKTERCPDAPDLLDRNRPLCRRVRFARLRAGVNSYWAAQLQAVQTSSDAALVLLTLFTWCTSGVILDNYE